MADPAPIEKYVTGQVTNLVVTRDGNNIKATWKNPAYMFDETRSDRATYVDGECNFVVSNPVKGTVWDIPSAYPGPPEKTIDYTGYDHNFIKGISRRETVTKPFDRRRYFPYTAKTCSGVAFEIHGGNGCDASGGRGPKVWVSYKFYPPRKPTVKMTYSASKVTVTIESDAGKDNYERVDTAFQLWTDYADRSDEQWFYDGVTTSETKWTRTVDISPSLRNLAPGRFAEVHCKTRARGMAGRSNETNYTLRVGMPNKATISSVKVDKKAAGGTVKVAVSADYRADTVKLQRRHGTNGSWTDVSGAVDDGNVKMFYDTYSSAAPVDGEYIYYRVLSSCFNFTSESDAFKAAALYTAKPKPTCSATVGIVSATTAKSGVSATVVMGWTDSTANEGTELSWSDDPNAWNSTDGPNVQTFSGNGSAATGKYKRNRSVTLSGLSSGVTYYLRMRRYRTVDGETIYSSYSSRASLQTESAADDKCAVVSMEPANDGTSCTVTVGIAEDNVNTGTELTWATYRNAWQSNEQPQLLEATWARSSYGVDGWPYKQVIYLRGLDPNTQYYIKARRFLDPTSGSRTYTPYSKLNSFTTPPLTASPDVRCGIVSIEGGADGESAAVVVGWSGNRTGCELTWSDDPDAWESTSRPSSLEFEWMDAESKSADWAYTATAYVHGLEQGATYYVRARSYYDGDARTYSDYTQAVDVTPYAAPSSVSLTVSSAVARGESIEVWWSVESDVDQAEWHIHEDGKPFVSLADGEGSLCRALIPPERYGDAGSLDIYVESGCGGGLTASNVASVRIADVPACEVCTPSTVTAKPAAFEVCTDSPGNAVACTCRAVGITVDWPDGPRDQLPGDVMWTGSLAPSWEACTWADTDLRAAIQDELADAQAELAAAQAALDSLDPSDEGYEDAVIARDNAQNQVDYAQASLDAHPSDGAAYRTVVEVPESAPLADGGSYALSVHSVEQVAGLASADAWAEFSVAWAHQAPAPSDAIALDVNSEDKVVTVTFQAPSGSASTDVYDLYRKTPTGYELVAEGLALDAEVVDPYAPFGTEAALDYRICTRTVDGDIAWMDYPYEMPSKVVRFDWHGGFVELPYNVELRESYSKSFESRTHVDGSVNGYWDKSVQMSGSYSSDVIRFDSLEELNAVRALGEHPGAVFCRTADGMAFQCDAQVREVASGYSSKAKESARIDVTAVKLTDDYAALAGRGGGE